MKVSEFIDATTFLWNAQVLSELFTEEDIRLIKQIRPERNFEDTFVWAHTPNGIYTVKSGYEFMSRRKHKDLVSQAEALPSVNVLHEKCWKVPTSPKIKLFLWKMLSGALAVSERLKSRGIHSGDGCLFCGEKTETINHILFECTLARKIWALANIPVPSNGFSNLIFVNTWYMLSCIDRNDITLEARRVILWILWTLLKSRNTLLFEGKSFRPDETIEKAFDDSRRWYNAQIVVQGGNQEREVASKFWKAPEVDRLKCNIGFGWSRQKRMSGAAWVVRDVEGRVLYHSQRAFTDVQSGFEAKLKSWEWALDSMGSLRQRNVTYAASSIEIVKALHKPLEWTIFRGSIAGLLKLTEGQEGWDLCYEEPISNRGATEVAKSVTSDNRLHSYVATGPPRWLRGLLEEERGLTMM